MTRSFRARVTAGHRNRWQLDLDIPAELSGRPRDCPVVGDYVHATRCDSHSPALITGVEPRTGPLAGKRPGDVHSDAAVLLGSSGVGKPSLVNVLAGQLLRAVNHVRDFDQKGRHPTKVQQLVELPWGGFLIDTRSLRELQRWGDECSLAAPWRRRSRQSRSQRLAWTAGTR